jgi:GT2 family glycosyltransferase
VAENLPGVQPSGLDQSPLITVSLVGVDQRLHLEVLLPSLVAALRGLPSEILLVDNRSTDGTGEFVRRVYPQVSVLHHQRICGYGENNNLNLVRARGKYMAVMNCDMRVEPNTFVSMLTFMESHPEIGILTPRVLNPDGSDQFLNKRFPNLLDLFLRRFGPRILRKGFARRMEQYETQDLGYEEIRDVEFCSGCFLFCRTDLLRNLSGFDPRFFLYFEDTDLCRRVQRTHRTVYFPHVRVYHHWRRASHGKWYFTWVFSRSAWRYFRKWGWKIR